MKLIGYKSEKGLFFANEGKDWRGDRSRLGSVDYKYNGIAPAQTHSPSWGFLEGAETIDSVQVRKSGGYINHHWELISKDLFMEGKIPLVISQEDSCEWYDDDDCEWFIGSKSEYYDKRSLYTRVYDRVEDYYEDVEFSIEILGTIEFESTQIDPMPKYNIWASEWKHKGTTDLDLAHIASYKELDMMLTPDLLIHNKPCSLTSEQTYKIVRKHISDNINPKCAVITSDYDFCFTVQEKITIKPLVIKSEIKKANGRSYAKPKFNTRVEESKSFKIFEMTDSKRNYSGYTPIVGFKGESLSDLAENIKLYLDELMEYINTPLVECKECNGTGHIVDKSFDKNLRK